MKRLPILLIIIIILLSQNSLYAQQGTFSIGFSLGLGTKGGVSFGYSITNKIIVEVYINSVPRFSANGIALRIYPVTYNYNSYLILGYSFFGTYLHNFTNDSSGFMVTSKTEDIEGFNFGIGNEFNLKNRNYKIPVEIGLNYIIDAKSSTSTQKVKLIKTENEFISNYGTAQTIPEKIDKDWSGFFLIGINSYFKLKSEKVKR